VDYVLVLFGGKIGYNADDLAKAYWIIKITSGYYDEIKEEVNFNIGVDGSSRFKRSLLFKMLYYRFHEVNYGGYDLARNQKLAEEVELKYLEEAYTTKNWLLRIYRVKKPSEVSDK
ncbi:Dolichyl-diphosphooligosaccharide--protein glycosyltransferase subunit stt3b, partial [Bonamia ostreae]